MKKPVLLSIIGVLVALLLVGGGAYLYLFKMIDTTYLNGPQRAMTKSIADTWDAYMEALPKHEQNKVTREELWNQLGFWDRHFADQIFALNAADLGFSGPFYGTTEPESLVMIDSKVFDVPDTEEVYETEIQYYPEEAYQDFERMVADMEAAIGKRIWIDSGYRSPGKQAYLFMYYLADTEVGNNFSLIENAKWITMPGYSEHGSGTTPAFDYALEGGDSIFLKADGEEMSDEETQDFLENTEEHQWMLANAATYNFYLSYPRGNDTGVSFEPWHWRWEKE